MPQQQLTPQQVQAAANAGVQLLQIKDLPVPLEIAKSGSLAVLEGVLAALVRGEIVITNPPEVETVPTVVPPDLESIEGGKGD